MRNLTKYAVMSAVMSAMLICTLPVYGTTVRDNYVKFSNVGYFHWYEASHKITDGQPWKSITSNMDGSTGCILVKAGRHGSEEVATWFKNKTTEGGHAVGTRDPSNVWPHKLNFAFNGHMILHDKNGRKTVCHNVVIGQGYDGVFNNWWIGGKHMHKCGGEHWLICIPNDVEVGNGYCAAVVPVYTSGSYTFPLDLWMCPPKVSVSLSSDVLWPANGKMHEIEATIIGGDACGASPDVYLTSVESNEPDSGTGGKDIEYDIQDVEYDIQDVEYDIQDVEYDTDDRVFRLRAERSKGGDGRVYTVTYLIIDGCGEETTVKATVTVPHDKGKNPPPPHFSRGKK